VCKFSFIGNCRFKCNMFPFSTFSKKQKQTI
jgi:hypothetical protein